MYLQHKLHSYTKIAPRTNSHSHNNSHRDVSDRQQTTTEQWLKTLTRIGCVFPSPYSLAPPMCSQNNALRRSLLLAHWSSTLATLQEKDKHLHNKSQTNRSDLQPTATEHSLTNVNKNQLCFSNRILVSSANVFTKTTHYLDHSFWRTEAQPEQDFPTSGLAESLHFNPHRECVQCPSPADKHFR